MTSEQERQDLFDETKATKFMDLYSRQIGTYGVETMKNLTKLRVLIVGATGSFFFFFVIFQMLVNQGQLLVLMI
mgnify:CR=1 FL=1